MKTSAILLCLSICLSGAQANPVNEDKPQKGEYLIPMVQQWSIPGVNQQVFSGSPAITVADDGRLFLYDQNSGLHHILNADGQWIKSFARRGEGPGEVKRHHTGFIVGDRLMICDDERIHRFTLDGEFVDTIPYPYLGNPVAFFIDGERFVSANAVAAAQADGSGRQGEINLNQLGRKDKKLIRNYQIFEGSGIVSEQRRRVMLIEFLTPLMTLAWDGQYIYYGMNDRYHIHSCDLSGRDLGGFSLNRPRSKMNFQEKKAFFAQRPNVTDELLKTLPDEQTLFIRMQVLRDHLLVFATDALRSNRQQIDVFDKKGHYLYRMIVKSPEGTELMRPQRLNPVISGDFAYLVLEDEDGEITLRKYRMNLPF